nr:carbon-nitrogen hydrolase family protein [Natribacillus halophilus]
MKVALGQFNPELGNKKQNLNKMNQLMKNAVEQNADLILFPELSLTGCNIHAKAKKLIEPVHGESMNQMQKWCKELKIYSVFAWPELGEDGKTYNSTCLISNQGEVLGVYRKVHPWGPEKQTFFAGDAFKVFDTEIGRIGLIICYDLDFPESMRTLKVNQADIILVSTANMKPYQAYQETYLKSRSMENEIPVAICNRTGFEGDSIYFGESAIYDAFGQNYIKMGEHTGIKTVNVPIKQNLDPELQYMKNRKPDSYRDISNSRSFIQ